MANAIMIDIETLGLDENAPILSIGAVTFNPWDPEKRIKSEFHAHLVVDEHRLWAVEWGTLAWWLKQSEEARLRVANALRDPAKEIWQTFREFCVGSFATEIWSNGPMFDEKLVQCAMRREEISWPFKHSATRDFKTVRAIATHLGIVLPGMDGVAHDALEDARHQAICVMEVFGRLKT